MKKYIFFLAAFLGALGIGLFWLSGFIENLKETSHAAGIAECEAKQAKLEIAAKECQYTARLEEEKKREKIYISPNKRRDDVLKLLRTGLF